MKFMSCALLCATQLATIPAIAGEYNTITPEKPVTGPVSRPIILEADVSAGRISRNGDAVNSSGPPLAEIEDLDTFALGGLAAIPLGQRGLAQIELDLEAARFPAMVEDEEADDTYDGSRTLGLQAGYQLNDFYLGGFAGLGKTDSSNPDQNADHNFFGLAGRWSAGNWSLAAQAGRLDAQAENPEVLSDADFGRLIGQRFFNNGRTKLQLDYAQANGVQDTDSDPADDLDIRTIGLEVEQMINWQPFGGTTSVYAAAYQMDVDETDEDGDIDSVRDRSLQIGLRIRFGAATLQSRARNTAPDLPAFGRWIGAGPVVD